MSRRLTILGAGESGTGAALLGKSKGWSVFVSDMGDIKPVYRSLLDQADIPYETGVHTETRVLDADLIVKSPGIPDKAAVVSEARRRGITVIDELEFAFRYIKGKIIAITGTNGKTTTTLLTYHLLKSAGFRVALGGNVGDSLARQVAVGDHDWYVVEISSFQLDGTETFRPSIGILTNITPDHLDRYDYKLNNYVNSKFRIASNMQPGDHFIWFAGDPLTSQAMMQRTLKPAAIGVTLTDKDSPVHAQGTRMHWNVGDTSLQVDQCETSLKGTHNIINTLCAVSAALLAGVPADDIRSGLATFRNAPHRLEPVATIDGVEFVNDSKATNVDSVVYALGSFDKPLIWIAGGTDKGNDYSLIRDAVAARVKTLICLGKDNTKLMKAFTGVVPRIMETQEVRSLVRMALQEATVGDVVLLSPACASFDLFKNYEDRGNQFRTAVLELQQELKAKTA